MKVLIGVTGGIAAYKAAELVRAFKKRGDQVRVIMTKSATEFITPLTLQVLSENEVGLEVFDPTYESEIGHIDAARWPDVILIAPATANFIGKIAEGLADDLLSTVILATTSPVVVAPAMNTQMWLQEVTQTNLETLRARGVHVVTPDAGELACKEVGLGRLPDPPILLAALDDIVPQPFRDKRVVVTAGPTREHLDPARFLSNPSTGKMGYAIAERFVSQGAHVTLISGPTALSSPEGAETVQITSAAELAESVSRAIASVDIVVMAAAVADWTPVERSDSKIGKVDGIREIAFKRTTDILSGLRDQIPNAFIVGFAAQTEDVEAKASAKREKKRADMIIANQIGGVGEENAFGSDSNRVCIITDGGADWTERASKTAIAKQIVDAIKVNVNG